MCPSNRISGDGSSVVPSADVVNIATCHEGHPRRRTKGRVTVGVGKCDAVGSETVHMRGLNQRVSIWSTVHRGMFVRHNEQNIGQI